MNIVVGIAYIVAFAAGLFLAWMIQDNLRLIWIEAKRANAAKAAFYVEVVRTLAYLRQETPEDTPRDTPRWPSEEDGE